MSTSTWRAGLPPLLTQALQTKVPVQWKCERRDGELSRAEAKEIRTSAGELDVRALSAFDAENSDPAANNDALTMTALAFDAECSDLDANLNEPMRPTDALERGTAENSFFQSGVGSVPQDALGFEEGDAVKGRDWLIQGIARSKMRSSLQRKKIRLPVRR